MQARVARQDLREALRRALPDMSRRSIRRGAQTRTIVTQSDVSLSDRAAALGRRVRDGRATDADLTVLAGLPQAALRAIGSSANSYLIALVDG